MLLSLLSTLALSAVPAPIAEARVEKPWTLLVYGAADNNADAPILYFLDSVRKAIDDDPGIEVLLLLDRREEHEREPEMLGAPFSGTRLYRLHKSTVERLAGGEELPEITLDGDVELDTGDPDVLRRFVRFGKQLAPARHYGLLVYGHADGRSMCPDEQSRRSMGIAETSDVLGESESVDFMALELCNMGGLEIAYQWRPAPGRFGADVLVAIPNAGPPLDWDRAFARIRSQGRASPSKSPSLDPASMSAVDFGRLVVEEGRLGRESAAERERGRGQHEAAAAYDLRLAAEAKSALDRLSRELAASNAKDLFLAMRGPGPHGEAICYTERGLYVDLYDLCRRSAEHAGFPAEVRDAARGVLAVLERFVIASFGMPGYAGFAPAKNGVFVVLPDAGTKRWNQLGWYVPKLVRQGKTALGGWAFLRDGATAGNGVVETWFELLDSWFDEADEEGGANKERW